MQNVIKEQIRKKVTRSGNGGAVWVPKDWLGEEIIITRIETPKLSIEEEIINILLPNLEKVIAIFLYGSYARNEQTKNSDIDVLVIVKEKFKIDSAKRLDVSLLALSEAKKAVHENPFIYSIIKESKAIINDYLLDELRKENKDFRIFIKWYAKTSLDNINSSKELIELDRMESEYLSSYSVIYSTMLRLRGIFLINLVLENKEFSNLTFKRYMAKFISESEYKKIYNIYRDVRDNRKCIEKIQINLACRLLDVLQNESDKHAKQGK